jgi:hypothetical protein
MRCDAYFFRRNGPSMGLIDYYWPKSVPQPLSLALVVMNLALLFLVAHNANEQGDYRRQIAELLIKQFRETDILLSKCVDTDELRKLLQANPPR